MPPEVNHIVIGSGPTGVSCAMALLARGRRVLMIDAGQTLEPARAAKLTQIQQADPASWRGPDGDWMREGMEGNVSGIPEKLLFGSDFPYRTMPGALKVRGEGVNTKYSLGKGGFSAVWGSATMPYREHDLTGWPVTAADLAEHYRAVLKFMHTAQGVDALDAEFPTFESSTQMPLSPQAEAMLKTLQTSEAGLRKDGVLFGQSRLAVNAGACVRCGLCMYGCPYGLIYSAAHTVERMKADPNFTYVPGLLAERLEETSDGVTVHVLGADGRRSIVRGERVFMGAGVLSSTAIMLRSLHAYDRPVLLKESAYFLLPMLRLASVPGFERDGVHTLAQLFLEVMDETVSPYTVHLQTYTYNDLFEQPIRAMLGPLSAVFPWKTFLSRLYLFQGYLHSAHSPVTEAILRRESGEEVLDLHPTLNPETEPTLDRLVRKLSGVAAMTGLRPLKPLMRRGEPGRGFHTGGSFPMSAQPQGMESDVLGRPAGLKRIHVVDSSVIPSVPATTITFTTMANAHRIGTLAG